MAVGEEGWWEKGKLRRGGGRSGGVRGRVVGEFEGEEGWWENSKGGSGGERRDGTREEGYRVVPWGRIKEGVVL